MPYPDGGVLSQASDTILLHSIKETPKGSSRIVSNHMQSESECGHGIHGRAGGLQVKSAIKNTTEVA